MVHYTTEIDPWFHTASAHYFPTATVLLDWLQSGVRIAFIQKARQSPDTPRNLKEQYLKCYQAICAELQANPVHMTMTRMSVFESIFRTDFSYGKFLKWARSSSPTLSSICFVRLVEEGVVASVVALLLVVFVVVAGLPFVLPLISRVCGVM
jgi:hypothetical protein